MVQSFRVTRRYLALALTTLALSMVGAIAVSQASASDDGCTYCGQVSGGLVSTTGWTDWQGARP
jgi:hypothetical protein